MPNISAFDMYGQEAYLDMSMRDMECRQRELEARGRDISAGFDAERIMEASARVAKFSRMQRKMHKMRKPLRPKKRRQVCKCRECGHNLDMNGNILRYSGAAYCCKCWNKNFYKCLRCEGNYRRGRQTGPIRICTQCQENIDYNRSPRSTDNLSWRKGSDIEGTTFDMVGSKRAFGIEIETAKCDWAERLEGKTPFGCKYDSTVSGREFDSPILSGDEGLMTILDFCNLAKSRGWQVDDQCGTHIHLDMRNESNRQLKKVALAYLRTLPLWSALVKPHRLRNQYCTGIDYTVQQILDHDFRVLASSTGRYHFINLFAYTRHQTIEIRGLEGSLERSVIANWIEAHLSFCGPCHELQLNRD